MPVSVGIDLGTTFSAVALVDPVTKTPRVIPDREGQPITPSVIQFIHGKPIFGSEAESAFSAGEPNCAATFKRNMGSDEPYCVIDGKPYTAEDLSALLLGYLKAGAEEALGDTIRDAVITVPAYFYSLERDATLRAAQRAGLTVRQIIDEPNAAAIAYGLNNWRENAYIMVYDLGGGTFDVTLTRMVGKGTVKTLVTRGDHLLGGRDWDDAIEQLLKEKFSDAAGVDVSEEADAVAMLRGMSEETKKKLSKLPSVPVTATVDGSRFTVTVTRAEFEDRTASLLERTGVLCRAVLEEAGIGMQDVTDVLLVGGSTRMPQVSAYLTQLFGKRPITHVDPDKAVALGAAIQATKSKVEYAPVTVEERNGRKVTAREKPKFGFLHSQAVQPSRRLDGVGAITLQETTAHAMGIVAIKEGGKSYYNEIIIPANHPRPVRFAKRFRFFTKPDSANELEIYVLQGDSIDPLACQIPYKFVVSGIRHMDYGESFGTVIRVQYSYDVNGIIHVQARQENDTVDLPIRKDVSPKDLSWLRLPPGSGTGRSGKALQIGGVGSVVHEYKPITFSNVKWVPYDKLTSHPTSSSYKEPRKHLIASEKDIEFHGYHVSAMDEGVRYTIGPMDDFDIQCSVDTSDIKPHPGGYFKIALGIISAKLDQNGGQLYLDGESVAQVGARFLLRMSLSRGGHYEIHVDRRKVGAKDAPAKGSVIVDFGFEHGSHCCELLSHAYVKNITMLQRAGGGGKDEGSDTATWED